MQSLTDQLRMDPLAHPRARRKKAEALITAHRKLVIGEPPCTGCSRQAQCGVEHKACRDFQQWVTTGRAMNNDRKPTRALYRQSYSQGAA